MNFYRISTLALFCLFIFGCQQTPTTVPTTISGKLNNPNMKNIFLTNLVTEFSDTIVVGADGSFEHNIETNSPQVVSVKAGKYNGYLFLSSGKNIAIQTTGKKHENLAFDAEVSPENHQLAAFADFKKEVEKKHKKYDIARLEQDTFMMRLNAKYNELEAFVNNLKNEKNIHPKLVALLSTRIAAAKAGELIGYPDFYEYFNKKEATLSDDYFDFYKKVDPNQKGLLAFDEGKALGRNMVEKDVDYDDFPNINDYFFTLFDKVKKTFNNPLYQNFFEYSYLKDKINYGGGTDGAEGRMTAFLASNKNKTMETELNQMAKNWEHLKSGLPAPDFAGTTSDGTPVKLSDLKGKNVYIDVWATWCGPCVREIPSLKEVEKEYHAKNIEFVSISIDKQKDREKWIKMVQEKDLQGVQIMAENAWQSTVTKKYNIRGIPRFILINEQGKIVTADAPRPSNPYLKTMLNELNI